MICSEIQTVDKQNLCSFTSGCSPPAQGLGPPALFHLSVAPGLQGTIFHLQDSLHTHTQKYNKRFNEDLNLENSNLIYELEFFSNVAYTQNYTETDTHVCSTWLTQQCSSVSFRTGLQFVGFFSGSRPDRLRSVFPVYLYSFIFRQKLRHNKFIFHTCTLTHMHTHTG